MSGLHQSETSCASVKDFLGLYLYGELSFDEEERVESHLDACLDCRQALERQRAVQSALDSLAIEPAPSLLRSCREDLHYRLVEEEAGGHSGAKRGWWEQFTDVLTGRSGSGWLKPAGALTLIALGFGIARLPLPPTNGGGPTQAGMMEPSSRVRYVEPASDGKVQIVFDETNQRIVSGNLENPKIRGLLLSAAKDPSDPGLRAETVEILNSNAQLAEVRNALIFALLNDKNAGVRLKVMQGLTPFAQHPEVRAAMTQVLLSDVNPGLRTQAIDLLTSGTAGTVDRQVMVTLQELMERG